MSSDKPTLQGMGVPAGYAVLLICPYQWSVPYYYGASFLLHYSLVETADGRFVEGNRVVLQTNWVDGCRESIDVRWAMAEV